MTCIYQEILESIRRSCSITRLLSQKLQISTHVHDIGILSTTLFLNANMQPDSWCKLGICPLINPRLHALTLIDYLVRSKTKTCASPLCHSKGTGSLVRLRLGFSHE